MPTSPPTSHKAGIELSAIGKVRHNLTSPEHFYFVFRKMHEDSGTSGVPRWSSVWCGRDLVSDHTWTINVALFHRHSPQRSTHNAPSRKFAKSAGNGIGKIHLRCDIVWCSTKSFCRCVTDDTLFAHSKVGDFYVTVFLQHDVVQLEIPVDDAFRMKEEETYRNFSRIKPKDRMHWNAKFVTTETWTRIK